MHNFKKTLRTTALFLLVWVLLSAAVITPYFYGENENYQDFRERQEIAGTVDYLIIGASHAKRAIDTRTLDERLGVNSFNLSAQRMPMSARYDVLAQEISRNPVKTLVMEVSFDTIRISKDSEGIEGELYHLGRLGEPVEKAQYFLQAFRPKDYVQTYEFCVDKGVKAWKKLIKGTYTLKMDPSLNFKGYSLYKEAKPDLHLKDYGEVYNTIYPSVQLDEKRAEVMWDIIDLCKQNQILHIN